MEKTFCALGCPPGKLYYRFPNVISDGKRRKHWLKYFDLEEPNTKNIFACERHFSHLQLDANGMKKDAVPDTPVICDESTIPFKRKPKNWRQNVVVITPRDHEFEIYRNETGIFPQNLFSGTNTVPTVIQIPTIKTVSCSMATQTNTRLCGLVEISDIMEEYRLNCFYCSKFFSLQNWKKFVQHIKLKHFKQEEAFKTSKFLSQEHDYTTIGTTSSLSIQPEMNFNMVANPTMPQAQAFILPTLIAKPSTSPDKPCFNTPPPSLFAKPQTSQPDKPFNINLADKLINLLNETILNPNFIHNEEDNVVIIKNASSNDIETSDFLTNIMLPSNITIKKNINNFASTLDNTIPDSSAPTRPIYTINHGQQFVPKRRYSLTRDFLPPIPKNKKFKLVQKRIAQQTLKNINVFEKIYKTLKTRHPKVIDSNKEQNTDKVPIENTNQTPLSRFLKRSDSLTVGIESKKEFSEDQLKQNPTELVFEYTPEDIIISLLDSIKLYPVLWKFHNEEFNKDYAKAVAGICRIINNKWSLNITPLKMRRSIIRILKFYRFMLSSESIDEFIGYFEKCALFLPPRIDNIPRCRCVYCWKCFDKDVSLKRHLIGKHKCLKWPYKCEQCFERFRERDEYELHKRLRHYAEIFKCKQCEKCFISRNLYHKHLSSHQKTLERRLEMSKEEPNTSNFIYECNVCHIKCRHYWELTRHKKLHREIQLYKCHLCNKEYNLKTTLKLHLKRHNKEFDFICEVCGKGFIKQGYLNQHMDTHTGAKITCNICNLKLRKGNLLRHLRLVHVATEGTIETAYRAKSYHYKKYAFKNTAVKRRAFEKLPRQYDCKKCKQSFDRLKQLKDHNKLLHSNVRTIPCKICKFEFKYAHNLKRHYRDKHKLHTYQIFNILELNTDINSVLSMNVEQFNNMTEAECIAFSRRQQENMKQIHSPEHESNFSDKIQDEIMKAVETIDKQDIKVDDDHSMNDFFIDLLKP